IALAITRDVQASEDIAQEAFIKAWQQLNQLHNPSSFLPWLRQITRNLARDWLRANRGRPLSGEAAEIAISMAADPGPTAPEQLLRVEEELAAEEIISALPEDARETLLLYYREGQSSQQVAELLGLSDAAVRKRLSRARASVREEMLRRFGDFARSSAPGAAFATTVASVLMIAAPGTASAAILLGTGLGTGKLGLGGATVSGGTALGSLSAALSQTASQGQILDLGAVVGGLVGGMLGSYLGGRYLMSYAESPGEREQVRQFVVLSSVTAMVMCLSVLMLSVLDAPVWMLLTAMVLGMGAVNYQCLFPLQKVMAPMLARDAAQHGRRGPNWKYQLMYGRSAVVLVTLGVAALVVYSLLRTGRL
ncbi:MAG TPA: RNA polymerase subunit sigma-70, partial [Stenotrophomonas sp.]|nr:RNA polymerase subunit sigma-70 [Stenotrophomonas sp.]